MPTIRRYRMVAETGVDSFADPARMAGMEWVSVTERMPDDGCVVLAWNGKRVAFGYCRDGQWIDTLYGWVIPNGPTHWMPLPEPPAQ